MKKFLGVIVALTMCVCLLLPTAFAADSVALGDVDLGALSSDELAALLGDVDICYASPKKAYEELGWKATHTLEEMCESTHKFQTKNS